MAEIDGESCIWRKGNIVFVATRAPLDDDTFPAWLWKQVP
jgi:hypothetical protein